MHPARYQSGEVRHVNQKQRANFVGDLPHAREVNNSRIRAASPDDQLRTFFLRQLFQIVIINRLSLFGDAVRNDAISFAGKIQVMAMREMSAMRQVQAKNRVPRLQHRSICFHIR